MQFYKSSSQLESQKLMVVFQDGVLNRASDLTSQDLITRAHNVSELLPPLVLLLCCEGELLSSPPTSGEKRLHPKTLQTFLWFRLLHQTFGWTDVSDELNCISALLLLIPVSILRQISQRLPQVTYGSLQGTVFALMQKEANR